MDGNFVPNTTFGPSTIAACRAHSNLPFVVNLLVSETHRDHNIKEYAAAATKTGCPTPTICLHASACTHLHKNLAEIKDMGCQAGVALGVATSAHSVEHCLDLIDTIVILTVDPGGPGRPFLRPMLP